MAVCVGLIDRVHVPTSQRESDKEGRKGRKARAAAEEEEDGDVGLMDSPPITLVRGKEEEIAASSDEHTNVTAADGKKISNVHCRGDVGNVL